MNSKFFWDNIKYVMSAILIFYLIMELYIYKMGVFEVGYSSVSRGVVLIIAILLPIVSGNNSDRVIGLSGIALGTMSVVSFFLSYTAGSITPIYIINVCTLIAGLALLFNSFIILTNYIQNIDAMKYSVALLFLLNIFTYLIFIHVQLDIGILFYIMALGAPYILFILVFFALLSSKGVYRKSTSKFIRDTLFDIETGLSMGNDVSMSRDVLKALMENDGNRQSLPLKSEKNVMFFVFYKVDGVSYVAFRDEKNITGIGGLRFRLIGIVPDGDPQTCGRVRLYGDNGVLVQLRVFDKKDNLGEKLFGS